MEHDSVNANLFFNRELMVLSERRATSNMEADSAIYNLDGCWRPSINCYCDGRAALSRSFTASGMFANTLECISSFVDATMPT